MFLRARAKIEQQFLQAGLRSRKPVILEIVEVIDFGTGGLLHGVSSQWLPKRG
jgi:hypothetical protein